MAADATFAMAIAKPDGSTMADASSRIDALGEAILNCCGVAVPRLVLPADAFALCAAIALATHIAGTDRTKVRKWGPTQDLTDLSTNTQRLTRNFVAHNLLACVLV